MRGFAVSLLSFLALISFGAGAGADTPDMVPLNCAWDNLPDAERTRLRDAFKVELKDSGFTLFFGSAEATATTQAAGACSLTLAPAQIEHLALALGRRAAEEKAKKGIADKGEDPASLRVALGKMHEGKREVIGNALGCPGPHESVGEWDSSLKSAIGRANLRFKDQRAYAWVSLGMYAVMAEEGALRRMVGQADACSPQTKAS